MSFLIACAQMSAAQGDIPENLSRMTEMTHQAARLGARLVVFPELCVSGYVAPPDASRHAISPDGSEIGKLRGLAREAKVALCFGFPERAPEALYNSMAFIDSNGSLSAVYRKIHLWVTEKSWAKEGSDLVSFPVDGTRCGMWICYDCRFPEVARALALSGVTLGLAGSAWFGPAGEWELAARARALDNGIFVAGATLQGSFEGAPFHGGSLISDPHGTVLASASEGEERVIAAEYDARAVESFRKRLPLLEHRRPGSCVVRA